MNILTIRDFPSQKRPFLDALKVAPKKPGCYRIFFKGDLIYVGKAVDLKKRLSEYSNGYAGKYPSSEFITEYVAETEVSYSVMPKEKIEEVEQELIDTFSPLLNKRNSSWLRGKKR